MIDQELCLSQGVLLCANTLSFECGKIPLDLPLQREKASPFEKGGLVFGQIIG